MTETPSRKDRIDLFGGVALVLFSATLGLNQVAIKVVNAGLQPVLSAGLRSLGGVLCLWLVFRLMGRAPRLRRAVLGPGLLLGAVFSLEFLLLFTALDLTSVARTSVIFYSMPVWAALGAHLILPEERLTKAKWAGLALAFAGVAWAILARSPGGETSITGDLCALGAALCWAAILLISRGTSLRLEPPESQLFWQVCISAPVLLLASLAFGPFLREPTWLTWAGLGFQIVFVVTLAFVLWFWLLGIYPAASVAAFGFLSPIFGVGFGWLLLEEKVGWTLGLALVLVIAGLWLLNRPKPG